MLIGIVKAKLVVEGGAIIRKQQGRGSRIAKLEKAPRDNFAFLNGECIDLAIVDLLLTVRLREGNILACRSIAPCNSAIELHLRCLRAHGGSYTRLSGRSGREPQLRVGVEIGIDGF